MGAKGIIRTGMTAAAILAMAALLAAPGCSAPPPPGAPTSSGVSEAPTVPPSAAATSSGATSAHQGTVSADTYNAIVKAMKASGMRMADESGLRMTFGADKRHVTVSGSMMTSGRGGMMGGSPRGVSSARMVFENGSWVIAAAK